MLDNVKKIAYGSLIIFSIIIVILISKSYLAMNSINIVHENNLEGSNHSTRYEMIKNTESKINSIKNNLVVKFKQKINDALKNSKDLSMIDSIVTSFIKSETIVDSENINILWGLIKDSNSDFEFKYLSDILATITPVELSKEIIDSYKSQEMTTNRKVILLGLLEETLVSAEYSDYPSQTDIDRITANHNIAMNFIKSLLETETETETEPEIFDSAFKVKMAISEPREIIIDIETLFTDDRSTNYKKSDLTNIILRTSLLDKNLQIEYLPKLLSDDYQKDEESDGNLNFWIHNTPKEYLSTQTLILLENRINESLQGYTDLQLSDALEQVKFMNNISAMAQLSSSEINSKEKTIVIYAIDNFVLNSSSPLKLATVIALSDEKTAAVFKERRNELIPTLKDSLLDPLQMQTDLIQEIIDKLNI